MTVFVDTSAIVALLDDSQPQHSQCASLWRHLRETDASLVTTSYVLVELCAIIQRRFGWEVVESILSTIVPLMAIHWVEPAEHLEAVAEWRQARRRHFSLVDCVSIRAMREMADCHVLGFDAHFQEAGLTLPPVAG